MTTVISAIPPTLQTQLRFTHSTRFHALLAQPKRTVLAQRDAWNTRARSTHRTLSPTILSNTNLTIAKSTESQQSEKKSPHNSQMAHPHLEQRNLLLSPDFEATHDGCKQFSHAATQLL